MLKNKSERYIKDLNTEIYATLMGKIKVSLNKWRDIIYGHGLDGSLGYFSLNQWTDLVQSHSKSQQAFPLEMDKWILKSVLKYKRPRRTMKAL